MSNTDKGVLFFHEWIEAMSKLSPNEFKKLAYAIYELQIHGIEPPEFQGKTALVAHMIFPYIRRRIQNSKAGKKGAAVRHPAYGINPYIDEILEKRAKSIADDDADS